MRTTPIPGDVEPSVDAWRRRTLDILLLATGLVATPSILLVLRETVLDSRQWPAAIAYSILYGVVLLLASLRRLPFPLRAGGLVGGGYAAAPLALARGGLMLLDLRMPGMDGVEVMDRVRERYPDLPIGILTGYATLERAMAAVRCGAADYLLKPISVHDLVRAVRRALACSLRHRHGLTGGPAGEPAGEILALGLLTLDPVSGRLAVREGDGEQEILLTPVETALLARLMQSPGQVLTYRVLAREVWGLALGDREAGDLVRLAMCRLRRKVEADPRRPARIRPVFGKGYVLQLSPEGAEEGSPCTAGIGITETKL